MKLIVPILLGALAGGLGYTIYKKVSKNKDKGPQSEAENLAWIDLPVSYQSLPANNKSAMLWQKIVNSTYDPFTNPRPTWNDAGGLWQLVKTGLVNLKPAFTCNKQNSDVLPLDRKRGIHVFGVVGRVQLSIFATDNGTDKNNFTGLLAKGSVAEGIIRLSLAAAPEKAGYMPGIGLKLFVDGMPSVNLVANYDLDGQSQNTNFFENYLRTTLPAPNTLKPKILLKRFEQIESPSTSLPVRDLALVSASGTSIMFGTYPFMLKFIPHERIVANLNATNRNSTNDFRDDLTANIEPDTPLYHVHAAKSLDDPESTPIGLLTLKTKLVASKFGDKRLCFKHQRNNPKWNEMLQKN